MNSFHQHYPHVLLSRNTFHDQFLLQEKCPTKGTSDGKKNSTILISSRRTRYTLLSWVSFPGVFTSAKCTLPAEENLHSVEGKKRLGKATLPSGGTGQGMEDVEAASKFKGKGAYRWPPKKGSTRWGPLFGGTKKKKKETVREMQVPRNGSRLLFCKKVELAPERVT